jgi:hypothetical protein
VQDVLAKSTYLSLPIRSPEAKFLVPDWGDKVDSGIGLSYRPARLEYVAWRSGTKIFCRSQLYNVRTVYPSQGLRIWLRLRFPSLQVSDSFVN